MSISNKIEEIRKKPEHIRMRYVWLAVAVSMFFILVIWVFSLEEGFGKINLGGENSGSGSKSELFLEAGPNSQSMERLINQENYSAENFLKEQIEGESEDSNLLNQQ
jgi:hypothetical protein